jgi:putative transposase
MTWRLDSSNTAKSPVRRSMRSRRKIVAGASYHVIARANRSEFILGADGVKYLFLQVLKQAKRRFAFTVMNLCIMDNHVHLIIRPARGASLSKIMQWVLSVFAIRYNRSRGLHGHVWYDRFKSHVIVSLRQFQRTFDYITENPVRAGIVETSSAYRFTGISLARDGPRGIIELPPSGFLTP